MDIRVFLRTLLFSAAFVFCCGQAGVASPPACAGPPAQAPVGELHVMRLIPTKDLSVSALLGGSHPVQGLHTPHGQTHLLQISEALERDKSHVARTVCAHEMGHALGLDHIEDTACWMYPNCNADSPVITWPNVKELDIARQTTAGKVYRLVIDCPDDPAIARAARWAAETWNCALGRDVIQVER